MVSRMTDLGASQKAFYFGFEVANYKKHMISTPLFLHILSR